ncbi:hypothetical protein FA95DRAFT_1607648 [Auriscalpium vulgare]|uniref:Uncharacterized protein n=1 Tax=Auriscalpium vulgare TaxID=40419 RepID=A0ACB8RNU7_9AGAM|nr:hypothetical protein FA95DRAFT_1607648 [Auriscalpium vulgare]
MRDFYTICNPGPGVPESLPESAPEPREAPNLYRDELYQMSVRDPDAGLTPAEAKRWRYLQEAQRAGKLCYDGLGILVDSPGGDHAIEYMELAQKSFDGQLKQEGEIIAKMQKALLGMAFDRGETDRMLLEIRAMQQTVEQELAERGL